MNVITPGTPVEDGSNVRPLILVVEDEVLVRMTFTNMLDSAGFRVMAVTHADEALEVLAEIPDVAAVVTDVALRWGSMNGFDLARKISQERHIGVLVASGRAAPEADELPPEIHFLAKPVHRATLVHLVQDLVGLRHTPPPPAPASRAPEPGPDPDHDRMLTPRQRQVLELLAQGRSNRDIALALSLAENTVKVHLAAIFRVLGVQTRAAAAVAGARLLQSS